MSSNIPNIYATVGNGLSLKSKVLFTAVKCIAKLAYHPEGTVKRRLADLVDIPSPPSSTPIDGVTSYDHTLDSSRNLWFRLFVPAKACSSTSLPVIVYFHGGGFVSFSPATFLFNTLCRNLAGEISAVVISVMYRRSPEHRWPAPYDDGFDVLRCLDNSEMREKIGGFPENADVSRCFLAGDSAGANIVHHVAVRASCRSGNGSHLETVRIRGHISIQPFFGGKERTESELQMRNGLLCDLDRTDFFWKAFLPDGSDRDHPSANVFGPKSVDISGLDSFPPTLVAVGGLDLLQDWQMRYCDGLNKFGKEVELVEYPNVGHAFYVAPELSETTMLVARIKEFIQKQLGYV